MVCTLFEGLPQQQFITATLHMETPPSLWRFNRHEAAEGYPSEDLIAATLRRDLGIDDVSLQNALTLHLSSRLEDLDRSISRVENTLFGAIASIAPSGPWRQAVIHLAQWKEDDLPGSIEELLAARVQYGESQLAAWRQQVEDLKGIKDRLEMFAAFADIEDGFEPFEERMIDLDVRLALEEERERNLRRGK